MMKYILVLMLSIGMLSSCQKDKEGCTDPNACNFDADALRNNGTCDFCDTTQQVAFSFNHLYNATPVTASDFNDLKYTNQAGNLHSISKLKYLISDVALHKANGDSVLIEGYNLVDLGTDVGLTYNPSNGIPNGEYVGVSFTWGFDATDNVSGAYPDLNISNWAWPAMLGGGYHFLQFEGMYEDSVAVTKGFAYHNGIAREITTTPDTIFHPNHFRSKLIGTNSFTIGSDISTKIEFRMNIANWFKTPYTWDLNQYGQMLMPNYQAQILMNQNGRDVFDYIVVQLPNN